MPVDRDIDGLGRGHAEAGAAQSGFTDDAFKARYAGGEPVHLGSGSNGAVAGGPQAGPAGPRSRNSYMRARARRLAAAAT